jgi:prepilin-type N-terminal cleavage/methylation domain-containing protein
MKNNKILNKKAFTMLELLLGLLIFSIVATTAYMTFATGMRLSHRSEVMNKVYRDARTSLDIIEQELENMLPYDFSVSYPDKQAFLGEENKITFLYSTKGEVKRVSYYLLLGDDSLVTQIHIASRTKKNKEIILNNGVSSRRVLLVREETAFSDYLSNTKKGDVQIEVISTDVAEGGLRFSYGFVEGELGDNLKWDDAWNLSFIPSNIKLEIDFLSRDEDPEKIKLKKSILIPHGFVGTNET